MNSVGVLRARVVGAWIAVLAHAGVLVAAALLLDGVDILYRVITAGLLGLSLFSTLRRLREAQAALKEGERSERTE